MAASTIAKIPVDYFEPPVTRATTSRRRRRRIAAVLAVAVVAAVGGWAVHEVTLHGCRGLTWPDTNLSRVDGECVGWTDEQAFAFEPGLRDLTDKIATENRNVASQAADRHVSYVKVAVLAPLTSGNGSALSTPSIRHSLEGVYVAQRRANTTPDFGTPTPLIQLVLVNEGRGETHWPEMTRALAAMKGGPHPVVAAVGLGVSIPATRNAAAELGRLGIPAIGAVLTATTLSTPGLFQVSPSNDQYITALAGYLSTRPDLKTAVLVYDTNDDDYVRSLRTAFRARLEEPYIHGRVKGFIGSLGSHDATPAVFDDVKQDVCLTGADAIFYAGRDRDLPRLIDQLAHRGECGHDKPLAILTGSTGLSLERSVESTMSATRITVIDASSSDYNGWRANVDAPAGFALFHQAFTRELPEDDLKDGYAIGHHDAVATAVWAIRRFTLQAAGRIPSGADVLGQITNLNETTHAVPAAGGTLTFDDASGGWPHGKKVPIIQVPAGDAHLPSYTTP